MAFDEVLAQVQELLQREKRVSYRGLKRRFALDDDYLEDLKEELIGAKRLAIDEDGRFLVLAGGQEPASASTGGPSPQPPPPTDPRPAEAERRQLTVMFCDLVGSTTLSTQLDPEELREVIQAYRETCATVIRHFEGYLAKYIGDGLLVYFGYPQAHEDDAQRAVRAGLGIVGAMQDLPLQNTRLQHPLQVRIGIHTGLVVAGEMGVGDQPEPLAIVGETPNIAARLQALAAPDTVVISAATQRLVQGLFTFRDLGPQTLRNVLAPVQVYGVQGESGVQSRFEVTVRAGLTPLIGREHEVGLLQERWERAKQGAGQVVLLNGEPGIGKSRLVQALKEQVMAEGATRIEFRCSPYHQNTALYPIIDQLRRLLQFQRDDSPQTKLDKLEKTLSHYRFPQADTLPLLAALLSPPQPDEAPPLTLSPQKQKQKQKTQEALVAWMVEEAERQVVYCAWEDLHWVDPSSVEVLTLLLEQVPTMRLLALLTFRPDFIPSWRPRSHITQLTLNRLGRHHVEAMVEQVTGGKALPAEVLQQIVHKTDGVPLFVEELTKMVLESGLLRAAEGHYELTGPLPPLAIPSTLQDSLMARLDRLASVREVARVGATLGREFSYELLQAVSPVEEASLLQALAKLVDAEVLDQRGLLPQARYLFKHALIQDAAYQSLLKSKRRQYHQQIAQVLEERFSETRETQPELLAHHYTEAGLVEQAVPYWQRAGQSAIKRSANNEAINHLTKGLELLKALPDNPERTQQELTLQVTLGVPLQATRGWTAPEVKRAYNRARELCQQVGEAPQLFPVLFALYEFYLVRAEHKAARELAEQCLTLAQSVQDPDLLLQAHFTLGFSLFHLGKLILARQHLEQGIALYDPRQHWSHAFLYFHDPGVACLSFAAWALWYLGYPDQALKKSQEALTLAQELAHSFSLEFALFFAAALHQFRREARATQERAETVMTLSTEQGFPNWLALGTLLRGWALAEQGQETEGIAQLGHGLAAHRATGAEVGRPHHLALLAEAYGKVGQREEGFAVLIEALATVKRTGERFYEAELYRLKGELTLKQSVVQGRESSVQTEGEECFRRAIEIARRQSAKSWELRATVSLARLWQQQGKTAQAQQMLAELYGWFTEGFDTADLKEAKALLDALL